MAEGRPPMPRPLKRLVLVEAGHRCAIPTCRNIPVEINHIDEWAKVREHTFENLIALCPTCHARYTRGEIDRQSMLHYKANLGVINSRYNDFERRILEAFSEAIQENPATPVMDLPGGGQSLQYRYLLADGLIAQCAGNYMVVSGVPVGMQFTITDKGRDFISKWYGAELLEDDGDES
jgi:hypothetical protein